MATDESTGSDSESKASHVPSGVEVLDVDRSEVGYRRRGLLVGLVVALPSLIFPLGWATALGVLIALSGLLHLFSDFGGDSGDGAMTAGHRVLRTLGRLVGLACSVAVGFLVASVLGGLLGLLAAAVGGAGGGSTIGAVKAGIVDYGAEWGAFFGCAWYVARRWRTRSRWPLVAPAEQLAQVVDEVSGPPLTVASIIVAVMIVAFALPSHRLWTPLADEWPVSAIAPIQEQLGTLATRNAEDLVMCGRDGWLTFDGTVTSDWAGNRLTITVQPEWALDQLSPFIDARGEFNLNRAGVTLLAAMHNQMAPWVDQVIVVFPPDAPVRQVVLNRDQLPAGTWVNDDLSVLGDGLAPEIVEEPWMDERLTEAQLAAVDPVCWS